MVAGPPFPVFEGVVLPTAIQPVAPAAPRLPPLGPVERERYRNMFVNTGAQNGQLDGEQARTIFLRARLPNETLGQIWYPRQIQPENINYGIGHWRIPTNVERWISLNLPLRCT
jgi:hypothetical protein